MEAQRECQASIRPQAACQSAIESLSLCPLGGEGVMNAGCRSCKVLCGNSDNVIMERLSLMKAMLSVSLWPVVMRSRQSRCEGERRVALIYTFPVAFRVCVLPGVFSLILRFTSKWDM